MLKKLAVGLAAASMFVGSANAADTVRIGFVTTLSTPAAVLGVEMQNAVNLAVEMIGGQMSGMDVEIVYEDDGFNPQTGRIKSEALANDPDIRFIAGYIWSHVLLASMKVVLDSDKFLISSNAGPSQIAGEACHENFFSTSWQNDQTPMALGEVLNQRGVESIYIIAPNYAAGKNIVDGVERTFDGEVLGRDMTRWGSDTQLDFSAELAKARASGADALFAFYPGRAGGAFIKQYEQAGLKDVMPLYTVFTVDAISLPKFQEAGMEGVLGSMMTMFWSPDLDNEQNNAFVSAYREAYGRNPSTYAAQAFDTIFLIKSAVEAVDGDLDDMDGMRAAMETANFPSIRGSFSYGNNHMPIQNFYLREAVVGEDGNWTTQIVSTVYENHQDPYAANCPL